VLCHIGMSMQLQPQLTLQPMPLHPAAALLACDTECSWQLVHAFLHSPVTQDGLLATE
jgi:hypothetical protein